MADQKEQLIVQEGKSYNKHIKKKSSNKVMEFYAHVVEKKRRGGEYKGNKENNKCSFWGLGVVEKRGLAAVVLVVVVAKKKVMHAGVTGVWCVCVCVCFQYISICPPCNGNCFPLFSVCVCQAPLPHRVKR